jgi:hypothetical protein
MSATKVKQIVLVGHCYADQHVLKGTLPTLIGAVGQGGDGIDVAVAGTPQELEQWVGADSLLLVNRVMEPGFETTAGLDLIRVLAKRADPPRLMLVSNYEDAQSEAQAAGALPGFGKAQLGKASTREKLQAALN